ncbi:hypothetical protein ACYPKM_01320 [Pseudomonas aeruginosa]
MNGQLFINNVLNRREQLSRGLVPMSAGDAAGILTLEEKDVPLAFMAAVKIGDVDVARELWLQRGPFQVDISKRSSNSFVISHSGASDGGQLGLPSLSGEHLRRIGTPAEARELFELVHKAGVHLSPNQGDFFDYLLEPSRINQTVFHLRTMLPTWGMWDLPVIDNGRLERGELAQLMNDLRLPGFESCGDDMLCLAVPEMLEKFPDDLIPFKTSKLAEIKVLARTPEERGGLGKEFVLEQVALKDLRAMDFDRFDGPMEQGRGGYPLDPEKNLRVEGFFLHVDPPSLSAMAAHLICDLAPKTAQHGLYGDGLVLCQTKASFLVGLPSFGTDNRRFEALEEKLESYFPLAHLHHHYGQEITKTAYLVPAGSANSKMKPVDVILKMARDDELASYVLGNIPAKLLKLAAVNEWKGKTLDLFGKHGNLAPTLEHQFGLKSTDFESIRFDPRHFEVLKAKNYKFLPGTKIGVITDGLLPKDSRSFIAEVARYAGDCVTIEGVQLEGPEALMKRIGVKKGLQQDRQSDVLAGQCMAYGLDSLVPYAKAVAHWDGLEAVFGMAELKKHLTKAPAKFRVKSAGRVFSL